MSANYVALLEARFGAQGYQFVNAGINGNLAWSVLRRLDQVIACRPDMVTLLVGANDVIGAVDQRWEATYRRQQRIPRSPTLDWYVECVEAILTRLQSDTRARIALLDLPMLGEDLGSDLNQRVNAHNTALAQLAAAYTVAYLPVHDRLAALLPADHRPPPFRANATAMIGGWLKHVLLRRSWSEIGRRNGLAVLIDNVHLAEPGAQIIANLVSGFLTDD